MEIIDKQRVHDLNDYDCTDGNYVLYWMHLSQRVHYNHSLVYAASLADQLNLPLLVFFGLSGHYPEANRRHYKFMLEGLAETDNELKKRNIKKGP